ncbi:IS66 family transposase [Aurantimonas sp. A3-2-R12]|uniref:IS66 family transposase n=1 Tax=Aurantimonas sp. A3-2-R12 TaxID=3114362 RepID=UPI002E1995C4|nr:IS66 family transposase [Aurantimonas sp. A3-2-R12]
MTRPRRCTLTDAEKDALLDRQAALIDALMARITALEAALAKPRKTSRNSHTPPSQNSGVGGSGGKDKVKLKKSRPSRPGVSRRLAAEPNETIVRRADRCSCGADVSGLKQTCRQRYDHVDIPPVLPNVTRIELHGGRCACGKRFRAAPQEGMPPGTPFGPNIHALLAYLHHSHHVGFERLARLARELFGLTISEGAVANALRRLETPLEAERAAIRETLRAAEVVWSDETTTRINGRLHWHWVFVTPDAVLHEIAPRRAKAVAEAVMGGHKPDVWISDRYAGQQEMAAAHQVCLAHVLRDVQYAIDCGDVVFAPELAKLLAWTIAIGRRRAELKDSTLRQYRIKADCRLDRLLATPVPHPAGRTLQAQVKAWRTKFFVFLEDRRVSATNNVAEREIRPSVVFRKVTGGFRSEWGPSVHAGYRSVTSTARIAGQTAFGAIRNIAATLFVPAAQTI